MPTIFTRPLHVMKSDIDSLNHVNNEVYLRWLIETTIAHSDSRGLPMAKFLEMQQAFVVRRHELDYLAPAYLNDELVVETWIDNVANARVTRHYKIARPKDGVTLLTGQTLWVYIDLKTGRPMLIPPAILDLFL